MLTWLPVNIVLFPALVHLAVLITREDLAMPRVMWMSRVGPRTLVTSLLILLAASVAPLSRQQILSDCWPVDRNGTVGMPTLEVALLLLMA